MTNASPSQNHLHAFDSGVIKRLYFDLLSPVPGHDIDRAAGDFLTSQLQEASRHPADMPEDASELHAWVQGRVQAVGQQYQAYLKDRRSGGGRRYFSSKSHALYFLKAVAPTKLVDGAWLSGLLQYWRDSRFAELIRTYLEELGEGVPGKNHVLLYKRLMAAEGVGGWQQLDDHYFMQGTLQLALARSTQGFLPELIGYNLGYEQLPLHLLITAYELNELDIDPYYFTLHVTVDNAATGHAHKALQGLEAAWPRQGDQRAFYRRVRDGHRLNELGASTNSVIAELDLRQELIEVLRAKSALGTLLHSNYSRIGGRSVNEWLARPESISDFLDALERQGWIKRNQAPENSRFWRLIDGEHAQMFGVFSAYEQQLIRDWIAGETRGTAPARSPARFGSSARGRSQRVAKRRGLFRSQPRVVPEGQVDNELRQLEQELAALPDRESLMTALVELMSPATHHTPAGLMATRMFSRLYV